MEFLIEDSRCNVFHKSVKFLSIYSDFICIQITANNEVVNLQAINRKKSISEVVFQNNFFKEYLYSGDFECCVDAKAFLTVTSHLGKFIV